MNRLPSAKSTQVTDYLREVAPWELERLESIDRLVSSWPDWGAERPGSRQPSYSSWLRTTYGIFRSAIAIDGAA
jgi:hypothetical protein